jgi:hypothetical protein
MIIVTVIISFANEKIRFSLPNTKAYVGYQAILTKAQLHNVSRSEITVLSSHILRSLKRQFQRGFGIKVLNICILFRLIVASWTSVS